MADRIFVPIGAAWKRTDKQDNVYLSGSIKAGQLKEYLATISFADRGDDEYIPFVLLINDQKQKDNHPDFNMFGTDPDWKKAKEAEPTKPEAPPKKKKKITLE